MYSPFQFQNLCFSIFLVIFSPGEGNRRGTVLQVLPALYMGLINKVDMVCLSPVGYGV